MVGPQQQPRMGPGRTQIGWWVDVKSYPFRPWSAHSASATTTPPPPPPTLPTTATAAVTATLSAFTEIRFAETHLRLPSLEGVRLPFGNFAFEKTFVEIPEPNNHIVAVQLHKRSDRI